MGKVCQYSNVKETELVDERTLELLQRSTKLAVEKLAVEAVQWGSIQLLMTSYLGRTLPPLDSITSVRVIVMRENEILVVRDPESVHILPGGRREAGETLLQTLQREMLEETGWTIQNISLLGFKHFHHLTPEPEDYPYPYPDFFQAIYRAYANTFIENARDKDGYELEVMYLPIDVVASLAISEGERKYIEWL